MKLNEKKCGLTAHKRNMNAGIQNVEAREQNIQKNLGLHVTEKLEWVDNCLLGSGKTLTPQTY